MIDGVVHTQNGAAVADAPVQACPAAGSCVVGVSDAEGRYAILGVAPGAWHLTAFPPDGSRLLAGRAGPVEVATGAVVHQDLVLEDPQAPPAGTTVNGQGADAGIPVLYWHDQLTLDTTGCTGGTATFAVTQGDTTVRFGDLAEVPAGSGQYHATSDPLYPNHGDVEVQLTIHCPNGPDANVGFSAYIDPSGTVVDPSGAAVGGATVTLLRADTASGPFAPVPNGSAVMSPSNRSNPATTGSDGVFHWDVLAGFYLIQAAKEGCHAVGSTEPVVLSPIYEVPPPQDGIRLTLDCGPILGATTTTLRADPNPAGLGQTVHLVAAVAGGVGAPTGTVAFTASDGSVTGCAAQPVVDGVASCDVTFAHASVVPLRLTAAYGADASHSASSGTTDLVIRRATPVLTWDPPAAIAYPAALGDAQLNATADIPGTFDYTVHAVSGSAKGVVLRPTVAQLLDVTFTPDNTADYELATAQVAITVQPGIQTITFAPVPLDRAAQPTFEVGGLATASSGLPVSFAGSGACQSSPQGHVVVVTAGQCVLTASQAGGAYQAATPVSQTLLVGAPSAIGLTATATTINAYHAVRITAVVDHEIRAARQSIVIVDHSARDRVLVTCWAGTTCSTTVSSPPGQHSYLARLMSRSNTVLVAGSPAIVVNWVVPTVWIVASSTTPTPGEPVTLTAFVNDDLTPAPFSVHITDADTGKVLVRCTTGMICSTTVAASGRHTYAVAIIGWRANGTQVVMGTPAFVTVG